MSDDSPELDELLRLVASDDAADVDRAHERALVVMRNSKRAKVIAAMAYDRTRAFAGRMQKFGTQSVMVAGERQQWPVDPATTDSERAKWALATLAELRSEQSQAPLVGKPAMRRLLRKRRAETSEQQVAEWSQGIARHGAELLAPRADGAVVAAYWPMPGEADPRPLAQRLVAQHGARLALPVVDGDDMSFREWIDDESLVPVGFGTLGPTADAAKMQPDIVLVPMLGFDAHGARIGQGKGYYDRKLASLPNAYAAGVAFAGQELPRVPTWQGDRALAAVISENGARTFS